MALIFRIERAKKFPRITVLREKFQEKKQGKTTKRDIPELLGSFNEQRPFEHITAQLSEVELYEFQNFVSTMQFARDQFDTPVDELDRFIFKAAPQMKQAFETIWETAQHYNIEFLPDYEMLLAALNRAKLVEQQLKVLTNNNFSALSTIGIDINSPLQAGHSLQENQKIIAALFETKLSYDGLSKKFNDVAIYFDKRAKFTAQQLETLQDKLLNEGKEMFPKWYYTIAIEVLKKLEVNLAQVASSAVITQHWLRLNKQAKFETTLSDFTSRFKEFSKNEICHNIIKKSFIDDELIDMGSFSQNVIPTPSLAVERWVNHWKKNQDNTNISKALATFKKAYPLVGENEYLIELIKKLF